MWCEQRTIVHDNYGKHSRSYMLNIIEQKCCRHGTNTVEEDGDEVEGKGHLGICWVCQHIPCVKWTIVQEVIDQQVHGSQVDEGAPEPLYLNNELEWHKSVHGQELLFNDLLQGLDKQAENN